MGWVMGFEPTNTGTTIRCLRPLGDTHHILFACQKGLVKLFESLRTLYKFATWKSYLTAYEFVGTPEGTRLINVRLGQVNCGMIAGGNHVYLDSLRGAPPSAATLIRVAFNRSSPIGLLQTCNCCGTTNLGG